MAWTRGTAIVTLLGVMVATIGLLFLGCGPNPGGGSCSVGSDQALIAYLFGSIGAGFIGGGLGKHMIARAKMHSARPSAGPSLLGIASGLVGGTVMILGLLFTCSDSLIVPGAAACGVGLLAALIAYSFGMVGAALATWSFLGIGVWRKGPASIPGASKS